MGLTVTSFAATELLTTGENVIAVGGKLVNNSSYPAKEYPGCVVDQDSSTKYLNYQPSGAGFVVVPQYGATILKSFQMTTGNDKPERDPASYQIFGSNDEITLDDIAAMDNTAGDQNNWTLIAEGTLSLPDERQTLGDFIPVSNETSYTAYKVIFPTVKDASEGHMQLADIQFYEVENPNPEEDWGFLGLDAMDTQYTAAVADATSSNSSYATDDWDTSKPTKISNGNLEDRYANFAIKNVGVAIWPAVGMTKLESFQLCTFTNLASCDPVGYKIYGTEDYQLSADNSLGDKENWILLSEGALNMPLARTAWCDKVDVNATEFYRGYKLIFTDIRDASDPEATVVHVAEMQFFGTKQAKDLGDPILRPGDVAKPIDPAGGDWFAPACDYPANENPSNALDGDVNTKYLNRDVNRPGFIVTPKAGKTVVKSMKFWTANDADDRDPKSWELYGTNEEIKSTDKSYGTDEEWTLIASGDVALPATRYAEGPLLAFDNSVSYASYKLIFPTLKGTTLFQIADTLFYSDSEGTSPIFQGGETALAVSSSVNTGYRTKYTESTQHAIDGNTGTKYYCARGIGTGIIFIPSATSSIVNAMTITTANDAEQRDPTSYVLYGTTDPITSADFSTGDSELWVKIAEGEINLPSARKTIIEEPIEFDNMKIFYAYKIIFPSIKSEDPTSGLQFSEIQFYGDVLEAAPVNLIKHPGDAFIAISTDVRPSSSYSTNPDESAAMLFDNNVDTKYYNQACWTNNIGFILTPSVSKELQMIEFYTANDYAERDPSSYKLYGTNDEITSVDNGSGNEENWTLIADGTLNFPADRLAYVQDGIYLDKPVTYSSYKMVFPTRKSNDTGTTGGYALGVQISDIWMYDSQGVQITDPSDFAIAVADYQSGSNYPAQEPPYASADGDIKVKYLNRGGAKSGFIVTPAEQVTPTAVMYTRANDSAERDPVDVEIYGTNDPIVDQDNSAGDKENWTLVGSGTFETSDFRFRNSNIIYFTNTDAFSSYRVIFPTLRGTAEMQIGEFYFFDLSEPEPPTPPSDFDFKGDVNYSGSANGTISAGEEPNSFTVKGSGSDVWGSNDEFFYAAKKVKGDFDYTVCVENFDGTSNAWAKAGIMVREADADDNQIGNARRFALQVQTESGKSGSSSDYWASYRDAVGADVGDGQCVHRGPFVYPHLQRIAYVDGVIYGMISEDQGETWDVLAVIDTNTWANGRLGAELPLYIGMWVTSHEANSNDATAEFSGVTLVDGSVPMS
ncbi:MAG: hypothetical protein J5672_08025, partial [Verrucomicrobia bacterium]|nr:hypothetical protein [Verrucomicrobiota bacterium]